jgi:hypothetical protein
MKKINRTLLIGLGGAGKDIVTSVKRNYKESDSSLIEYLVIDTDLNDLKEESLQKNELLHIGIQDPKKLIDSNTLIQNWLPNECMRYCNSIQYGANQLRGMGRLALLPNYISIKNLIKAKIQNLNDYQNIQLGDLKEIEVIICFSICGGTGSGIFLDVANIAKEYLNENGLINANILMPSIYDDKINQPIAKRRIFGNAYASMRELDFFMSWRGWHKEPEYILKMMANVDWKMYNHTSNGPFNNVYYYNNQDNNNRHYQFQDIIDIVSTNITNENEELFDNKLSVFREYDRYHEEYYGDPMGIQIYSIDKRITQKMEDANFELVSMTPNYN